MTISTYWIFSMDKIGIYSEGMMPGRSSLSGRQWLAPPARGPRSQPFPTPSPAGKARSTVRGGALGWAWVCDLPLCPQVSVTCVPRIPSIRRAGRGSRAEAKPGAPTGRSPACQRCRWPPLQTPGAHHWSPGRYYGRCSRRLRLPGAPHTE